MVFPKLSQLATSLGPTAHIYVDKQSSWLREERQEIIEEMTGSCSVKECKNIANGC